MNKNKYYLWSWRVSVRRTTKSIIASGSPKLERCLCNFL